MARIMTTSQITAADAAKVAAAEAFASVFVKYADTRAVTLAKVDATVKASADGVSLRTMPDVLAKAYRAAKVTATPPGKSALGYMLAADAIVSQLGITRDADAIAEAYTVASNADAESLKAELTTIAKAPKAARLAKLTDYRESGRMSKAKADAAKARRDAKTRTVAASDAKAENVAKATRGLADMLAIYAKADTLAGIPAADVLALDAAAELIADVAARVRAAAQADVKARVAQANADAAKESATRPAIAEQRERAAKADAKAKAGAKA